MIEDRFALLRLVEALVFAASEPVSERAIAERLPDGADVKGLMEELRQLYANRGVTLVAVEGSWAFRTAPDLAQRLRIERTVPRRLSRAAVETLAIIAYHQPVTRAEIEEIRGVALSRGTLDSLLEAGWIQPKGRRRTPGRPATWRTTPAFLDHFGLENLDDLPGVEELKAAGLLDARPALSALGQSAAAAVRHPEDAGDDEDEDDVDVDVDVDVEGSGEAGGEPVVEEPGPTRETDDDPEGVGSEAGEPEAGPEEQAAAAIDAP
jgi:segregation and condensation protein B